MTQNVASYSFLPYLRQGIANKITASDKLRANIHAKIKVIGEKKIDGSIDSQLIDKLVYLSGPGEIISISSQAVIKTEPMDKIGNFEPNYLPYIEFYDEDFPWRYTPEAPNNGRLKPWIMLVVLKEGEFSWGENLIDRPLKYFTCKNYAECFPPWEELWAWAHVHVNRNLDEQYSKPKKENSEPKKENVVASDINRVLTNLQTAIKEYPDLAYSRILCPRQLVQNTHYYAFLIPSFETGRLAGLKIDFKQVPSGLSAFTSAWADYAARKDLEPNNFPYYYSWEFSTGVIGDFEYLVRLLKPKQIDSRVGRRDMDVQHPGYNLSSIKGGVLKLGGALQPPRTKSASDKNRKGPEHSEAAYELKASSMIASDVNYKESELSETAHALQPSSALTSDDEKWDQPYPCDFQKDLANFINLADDYSKKTVHESHKAFNPYSNEIINEDDNSEDDPDPMITPPLYGQWHALVTRLQITHGLSGDKNDIWINELNLDPRFRVAAGFGTLVIQKNQEEYMNFAWEQLGQIQEANNLIRLAKFGKWVSNVWYERDLKPLAEKDTGDTGKLLQLMAPMNSRVFTGASTVQDQLKNSAIPPALLSAPARRVMSPRSRLIKSLAIGKTSEKVSPSDLKSNLISDLMSGIYNGHVKVAMTKEYILQKESPRPA